MRDSDISPECRIIPDVEGNFIILVLDNTNNIRKDISVFIDVKKQGLLGAPKPKKKDNEIMTGPVFKTEEKGKNVIKKPRDLWKVYKKEIRYIEDLLNEEYRAIFQYLNSERAGQKENSEEVIEEYLNLEQQFMNQSMAMVSNLIRLEGENGSVILSGDILKKTIDFDNYLTTFHFPRDGKKNKFNRIWMFIEKTHQDSIKKMNSALNRAKNKANDISLFLDQNKLQNYQVLDSDGQRVILTNNDEPDEEE